MSFSRQKTNGGQIHNTLYLHTTFFKNKWYILYEMTWCNSSKATFLEYKNSSSFLVFPLMLYSLWAQTLNSLYMLDGWKKNENGITMAEVCQSLLILATINSNWHTSAVIPFSEQFHFFFHQSNVYKLFRVWAHSHTGSTLDVKDIH